MCGIVGYCGPRKAMPVLIQGLRQLEYRGYDSSGVAFLQGDSINVVKKQGKLVNLENALPSRAASTIGIAHTRWATHGGVSDENAHPHLSGNGKVAVVHNGIIDNFVDLRRELQDKGYEFKSETDSEVLAHLIDYYLDGTRGPEEAVSAALDRIEGTYGIIVLFKDDSELLIGARNGSPLIVGVGEKEMILASDATAFIGLSRQAIFLDDGEMAVISPREYRTVNRHQQEIQKPVEEVDIEAAEAMKGEYEHFLIKEIMEQPDAVSRAMGEGGRLLKDFGTAKLGGLNLEKRDFFDINRIHILAMGTGYYAGMVGAGMIENLARIPVQVFDASEYRVSNPIVQRDTLYLAISQSGETADTIMAVKEVQNKGGRVLGIVNVVGSTLARLTEGGVYTHAGPEKSVASTKAFTSQSTVLALMALLLGRMRDVPVRRGKELVDALLELPNKIHRTLGLRDRIRELAKKYKDYQSILYMARGNQYAIALEGALKLKEISYIHAEGFSSGGLKHGPLALISEDMPSVFIAMDGETLEKDINNIQEVRARKGPTLVVTDSDDPRLEDVSDDLLRIPKTDEVLSPILTVVPMQLFAYYVALELGREIDQPRNLAKSVTVE
jgi:glucosamine--fructose-6-phosphate aminotransferase (isomerizing)